MNERPTLPINIARRALILGNETFLAPPNVEATPPFFNSGRRMYVVAPNNGTVAPIGDEHLIGEMGGVWAHPVKVADGVTLALYNEDGAALNAGPALLDEALSHLTWRYNVESLAVTRRDVVAEDDPAYIVLVSLENHGRNAVRGRVEATAHLKMLGCWFGGLVLHGHRCWVEDGAVVSTDANHTERWGAVYASEPAAEDAVITPRADGGHDATLVLPYALEPGERAQWEIVLTAESQHGPRQARNLREQLRGRGEHLLREKDQRYRRLLDDEVTLVTPDDELDRAFQLARVNLHMLTAEYPNLPRYFLAGIPEYPQLFGCDTEYSVTGAVAGGFTAVMRSTLEALAQFGQLGCGRIPHEVTTNGRIFHPGNTQETPQFVQACWDYLRWTGDIEFVRGLYPLCREGIDALLPAFWSGLGKPYPIGDGMIERHGMGARKLDTTLYLWQALMALSQLADALGHPAEMAEYAARAAVLRDSFERDWWMDREGLYADSLHYDLRHQLDGHWTIVLPVQIGIASPERARRVYETVARGWINEWGVVHTKVQDERVWTLPTGLFALAAFNQGDSELGVRLLRNIAITAENGTLGTLKELIPIGICFVQLWSSGLLLQGVAEGLFGIQPNMHRRQVLITPRLPDDWPNARLGGLHLGPYQLDLTVQNGRSEIGLRGDGEPLTITYLLPRSAGPTDDGTPLASSPQGPMLSFSMSPGDRVVIDASTQRTSVSRIERSAVSY